MAVDCNVCGAHLAQPLYRSPGTTSLTSLCEVWDIATEVFYCAACGHVQSAEPPDISRYYDSAYKILLDSEEEDQVYRFENGVPVYRTDHQVATLLSRIVVPSGARVLDYGCAKGAALRKLAKKRPDIDPCLFDVSRMYEPFWQKFSTPDHWAVYRTPQAWAGSFDLVTSFYSLEHVAQPRTVLEAISSLLKPGGTFYCIVPNTLTNTADLIVTDHVNHFTRASLTCVLQDGGFSDIEVTDGAHDGAWVAVARRRGDGHAARAGGRASAEDLRDLGGRVRRIAEYWQAIGDRVRRFEAEHADGKASAIYGSGFYGAFIATCLKRPEQVCCFLDRNPYRQGKQLFGKPVIAPEALATSVRTIYVGLSPATAARDGADPVRLAGADKDYFFL
jgi:SAM-dependent methyltransferase